MKHSGMGREQGIEGVRAFQDTRSIAHAADSTARPRPRTERAVGAGGALPRGPDGVRSRPTVAR